MKLERLPYDPMTVLDFYESSLPVLGALCERTWHDRLEILADGPAAALWDGNAFAGELRFVPPNATGARDATGEVFPGCPLTFRLAEALHPRPLAVDRLILARGERHSQPPDTSVAEKTWRGQFPQTGRWRMTAGFKATWHFSLVVLVRSEIQAIDQHWSLHRLAVSLPDGGVDEDLARELSFASLAEPTPTDIPWPVIASASWHSLLHNALAQELTDDLVGIRQRQQNSLRRELERIEKYFADYESELALRARKTANAVSKLRASERLAAAKAEHARRRADQISRHEIRVIPHLDAFLFTAEPAWTTQLQVDQEHQAKTFEALFTPRDRKWHLQG